MKRKYGLVPRLMQSMLEWYLDKAISFTMDLHVLVQINCMWCGQEVWPYLTTIDEAINVQGYRIRGFICNFDSQRSPIFSVIVQYN